MAPRFPWFSMCLVALGPLSVLGRDAIAQSTWDRYQPGSITTIIAREREEVMLTIRQGLVPLTHLSAVQFPTRAIVQYEDSTRPISAEHLAVLTGWARSFRLPVDVATVFSSEALFREDTVLIWIPIQAVLMKSLRKELHRGSRIALYVGYAGAQASDSTKIEWVFMANEFTRQ